MRYLKLWRAAFDDRDVWAMFRARFTILALHTAALVALMLLAGCIGEGETAPSSVHGMAWQRGPDIPGYAALHVLTDSTRGVTCYAVGYHAISCLPTPPARPFLPERSP